MNKLSARKVVVTLKKSKTSDQFLHALSKRIRVSNIKISKEEIVFSIKRRDLEKMRGIRATYHEKLSFKVTDRENFLKLDIISFISFLLLILMPIILNAFLWEISIEDATPELEDSIQRLITENGLKVGKQIKTIPLETEVRQTILAQHQELSWVFVTQQGSKINLKVKYSPVIHETEKQVAKGHLVARKAGVITHANIEKGERVVTENTSVEPGELLVSGIIKFNETAYTIGAVGEVFADYWLEVDFTLPKEIRLFVVESESWLVEGISIPKAWALMANKLPLNINIQSVVQSKEKVQTLTKESAPKYIMPLLEQKMLQQLPINTTIKNQKLLHLTMDNDTVKGKILFLINENIAQIQPFTQGD